MHMLEHSKRKFKPKYNISNFRIGKLPEQIKCHKFSVGKSKLYYILTGKLVDPNYLKLSRLNRLVGKS